MRPLPRSAGPLAFALVLAVGIAVRVVVARQSIFSDELSTFWIVARHGFGDMLSLVHSDAEITPPFSFTASWLSTRIGDSPLLLRLPALIAGSLTIPAVYLIGRRTIGGAAALVAATLTALAPFMIYYSAEARGYGVMVAFVTLSTLAMLQALDDRRMRWWVAYGALTSLAVYTHYTAVFVLAAQLGWLLWTHPEARRPALMANVCAVVVYLPWATGLVNDLQSPTTSVLSALQPFTPASVRTSLLHWTVGYPYSAIASARKLPGVPGFVMLALATVVSVGGLVAARRSGGRLDPAEPRRADHRLLLIVALALATPLAEAALSAVGTNLFSTRNLAASWPGFALAFAALLTAAGPRLRYATAALAIAAFAIGAVKMVHGPIQRPQYEPAAHYVDRTAKPGDVVVDGSAELSPGPLSHIDPYLDRPFRVVRAGRPQEDDHPFTLADPIVSSTAAVNRAVAVANGHRIIVVYGGQPIPDPPGYVAVASRRFTGFIDVAVRVFTPRPS